MKLTSNVEDGIERELVQLHTVNEKEPTKKFVGRRRKAVEEEGKEDNSEAIYKTWDDLVVGKDHLHGIREESAFLAFDILLLVMADVDQFTAVPLLT
jgi:hypothetical protein